MNGGVIEISPAGAASRTDSSEKFDFSVSLRLLRHYSVLIGTKRHQLISRRSGRFLQSDFSSLQIGPMVCCEALFAVCLPNRYQMVDKCGRVCELRPCWPSNEIADWTLTSITILNAQPGTRLGDGFERHQCAIGLRSVFPCSTRMHPPNAFSA